MVMMNKLPTARVKEILYSALKADSLSEVASLTVDDVARLAYEVLAVRPNIAEYRSLLHKTVGLCNAGIPVVEGFKLLSELEDMWLAMTEDDRNELRTASQAPPDVHRLIASSARTP